MADANTIDIDINVKPKTDGIDKTVRKLGTLQAAVAKAKTALKGLSMVGFATVAVEKLVALVSNIGKAAEESRAKMAELAREAESERAAEGVKKLAESYKALKENIAAAKTERERLDELDDINRKNQRDLEDARLDQAEAKELAAVAEGPEAERQRAAIRARYDAERAGNAEIRREHDIVFARKKLTREAEGKRSAAEGLEAALAGDDEAIRAARIRLARHNAAAETINDKDNTGFWNRTGADLKNLVSLNWGKMGEMKSEEGDKVRDRAREDAKAERARIESLETERERKRKEIAQLRQDADAAEAKASAMGGQFEVSAIRRETAGIKGRMGVSAADRAVAEAEATRASALAAAPQLEAQLEDLKRRIEERQADKAAADRYVFEAQGRYDNARLNGDRRGMAAGLSGLQAAQEAAQNVHHGADTAINAMVETLKEVERRFNAVKSYLDHYGKRQEAAWSEAPAGR
ncbi:MAG: hypothetical protein K6G91_08165 [Kiritimatiellae bacterium]|nr:hypothetical protein [Kiritimatiellia bacterium]